MHEIIMGTYKNTNWAWKLWLVIIRISLNINLSANAIAWATLASLGVRFGLLYSWNIPHKVSKKY
jgi:hypothetical protein